jgi:AraC family transcriptional regulator
VIAPGQALYGGAAGDTRLHRHHALQLVVGLPGPFEAQLGCGGPPAWCEGLLVASDAEHRVDGRGRAVAIYYVDGSSGEARALSRCLEGEDARALAPEVPELRSILQAALAEPGPAALRRLRARVAEILRCPSPVLPEGDPAVLAAAAQLEERLAAPLGVPELARRTGLRQRELSARFRKETGLTIRRYVLWLRLKAAVASLGERRTLTEAAHAAGFADAAHLSRTFVEMFGVVPSESVAASSLRVLEGG